MRHGKSRLRWPIRPPLTGTGVPCIMGSSSGSEAWDSGQREDAQATPQGTAKPVKGFVEFLRFYNLGFVKWPVRPVTPGVSADRPQFSEACFL
jgi:hypothetical protein